MVSWLMCTERWFLHKCQLLHWLLHQESLAMELEEGAKSGERPWLEQRETVGVWTPERAHRQFQGTPQAVKTQSANLPVGGWGPSISRKGGDGSNYGK